VVSQFEVLIFMQEIIRVMETSTKVFDLWIGACLSAMMSNEERRVVKSAAEGFILITQSGGTYANFYGLSTVIFLSCYCCRSDKVPYKIKR
jgi:hypothetical protein